MTCYAGAEKGTKVERRIVALFSCGAASAVATKLAISCTKAAEVAIHNTFVAEEHPDNQRFLQDCQGWFGHEVETFRNEKYSGSIYEVFRKERYIKNRNGAACTRCLKRDERDKRLRPDDLVVVGFTAEEEERYDRFIDANQHLRTAAPLIEKGVTKSDCLAMVERARIELPTMYRLGFHNNNCRGCVKGGKGYWNKVRRIFPAYFERMACVQDTLGPGSYFWPGAKEGDERISLRALPENAGDYESEPEIQCGLFCEMAERDMQEAA